MTWTVRAGAAALMTGAVVILGMGCGGPSEGSGCGVEEWSGMCSLRSVTKIQEAEFPAPHVVMEIIYSPETDPRHMTFTPPELREEVTVMANQEQALRDHLERSTPTACHLQLPPAGTCVPGKLVVNVPPFDASRTASTAPVGPTGCQKIESSATQDTVRGDLGGTTTLPEFFQFEEGSAELSAAADPLVQAIAQRMKANPAMECVAVIGQVSPGEQIGLADSRARAVKERIAAAGVDPNRMVIISLTQAVFGKGTVEKGRDTKLMRVSVRVLLDSATH